MKPNERIYHKPRKLYIEDHKLGKAMTKIKKAAYSSFDLSNFQNKFHISKVNYMELVFLVTLLQKVEKGKLVALVNCAYYQMF